MSTEFSSDTPNASWRAIRRLFDRRDAPPEMLTTGSQQGLRANWLYDLGYALKKVVPEDDWGGAKGLAASLIDQKPRSRKLLDELVNKLHNILVEARALVQAFPARSEFKEFSADLRFSIVRELLKAKNLAHRKQLRARCLKKRGELKKRWSLRDLKNARLNQKGRRKGGGGREVKVPQYDSLPLALQDLHRLHERWEKSVKLWFTESGTANTSLTTDEIELLEKAVEEAESHAKTTSELRKVLRGLARPTQKATPKRSSSAVA